MNFSAEQISAFHRALYRSCDYDAMRMSAADERNWFEFLKVMEPLEDTQDGAFRLEDLVNVLADMRRQNNKRDAQFRFAMRPITILRDPERFRDMVLESRRARRQRPRPAPIIREVRAGSIASMAESEPAAESEPIDFLAAVADEQRRIEAGNPKS